MQLPNLQLLSHSQVQEIHEGLHNLRRMVSELENKQKTVLGVALPEESECVQSLTVTRQSQIIENVSLDRWCSLSLDVRVLIRCFPLGLGMKKELQTLREEIKTLAGQIQRKLKSEYSWRTSELC